MGKSPPFFLVPGGPAHALARRLGLARDDARDPARLAVVLGLVPWVVLMVIATIDRLLAGRWPLLVQAPSVHMRLLVAIPAFIFGGRSLQVRTRRCIERLEGFVDPAEERFSRYLRGVASVRDAVFPELLILTIVVVYAALTWSGVESVRLGSGRSLRIEPTVSQLWYGIVALPVFHFLGLRWIWHWGLWTVLLARISALRLRPIASHPDRRGGLAFLMEPQVGFSYAVFGLNAVMAAGSAIGIDPQGFQLPAFTLRLVGLVVVGLLVVVGPLLPFAPPLFRARFAGLRAYDGLAAAYTSRFQRRWIEKTDREELLGTPDIQSLADLTNSCDVVRQMRVTLCTREMVLLVVVAVIAPFVATLLAKLPLATLLEDLANSFLGRQLF